MNSEAIILLARALSAQGLYEAGHPARNRALVAATRALAGSRNSSVTFLDGRVIVDGVPEPKFQGWSWGLRLEGAGVQRIEVDGEVTEEDLVPFLNELHRRLDHPEGPVTEVRCGALRFGAAGVDSAEAWRPPSSLGDLPAFTLEEEAEVVAWVFEELRAGKPLDMLEVDLVVRSLMAVMQGGGMFLVPLVRLRDFDQYTTAHSMNVAVLSMALAEFLGLESSEVRGIGVAGILHDIGRIRVPKEVLVKPGKLTPEEMELIRQHPVDGARMILASDERLELAATVAYEHHVWFRGGGYPSFGFRRKCHPASNLLHVCDVYNAFATDRPYREAWEHPRILEYIAGATGTEFDPFFAESFRSMMDRWQDRIAEVDSPSVALPVE
ncbi:MAG: HD domain-containing protein [Gemmatimonadales bacterium]|nr:MAG: HD domain-containing protein [Gemmatimonadales bacterium]